MNIGFVSTRFAGTDGVSLESSKWADVLEQNGYRCFWFGGEVDRHPQETALVPEAHFKHEQVQWINNQVYGNKGRTQTVTGVIHDMRTLLKSRLHDFVNQFDIDGDDEDLSRRGTKTSDMMKAIHRGGSYGY